MSVVDHGRPATDDDALDKEVGTPVVASTVDALGEDAKPIDPQMARRVLRKIDMSLMPAMMISYGLVYWDKAILGSAVLFGMTKDLSLSVVDHSTTPPTTSTTRLSWATSIFYFGQLVGSYPMIYALQRFKVRHVLGPAVTLWAVVCAATAGVTS